jgi:hypothetical protein
MTTRIDHGGSIYEGKGYDELVAAIRALPRYCCTLWKDGYEQCDGIDCVKWSDVARLLGDPAQEQP